MFTHEDFGGLAEATRPGLLARNGRCFHRDGGERHFDSLTALLTDSRQPQPQHNTSTVKVALRWPSNPGSRRCVTVSGRWLVDETDLGKMQTSNIMNAARKKSIISVYSLEILKIWILFCTADIFTISWYSITHTNIFNYQSTRCRLSVWHQLDPVPKENKSGCALCTDSLC